MKAPVVYCILGMHRSGTSLLTRLLSLLGVELGPDAHLMAPTKFNPTGFWEHEGIVALNDELLARLGGRWQEPPPLAPGWERDPALDDLREKARALVAADFAGRAEWGFKDPRTCLTLPFWKTLLPPMRYILCVRNPADVAHSLEHAMPFECGAALWTRYVAESLSATAGEPRELVHYEDLLADPGAELRRLTSALQLDAARIPAACEFARADLRHHHTTLHAMMSDERIPFAAKALFAALLAHSPAKHHEPLDALARSACDASIADSGAAPRPLKPLDLIEQPVANVCDVVSEHDAMYRTDSKLYFRWGEMALQCIRLAMAAARKTDAAHILDLPCGHGRALRYLRAAFPHARLTACDLDHDGVDFCARMFGARPVYSDVDPRRVEIGGKFDVIWVGALFTHLPAEQWGHFFEAFTSWLMPGGLLIFTTHGREIVDCLRCGRVRYPGLAAGEAENLVTEFAAHGFSFRPYVHHPGYGISVSSLAWICGELQKHPSLQVVMLKERGWFHHHDAVACIRVEGK